MLPPIPSLSRLPPPSLPSFFPNSFSSSIAGNRRLNLHGGCWRHVWPSRNVAVICMANQRRVKMVAKQIRRELSDMLLTDKVIKYAVLPEASLGADRYLSSLTTISDVVVSGDLQVVKVYVSVFGDERGKEVAIAGLKAKTKYVRSELGKRMKLRLTPEIRFIPDDSIERGSRVIAILDKLKDERENSGRKDEEESRSSGLSELDEDWAKMTR
ncbi:hypothetical protein KFK09_008399 [Dendrobium nobile]|uniref:Ribosome-binding factor A n=1 Tax=Dendrobium nobile TaxID=94219 RepID=A0A8T3BNM1_DENNO|nr:hypothetical protein KFK09_008399 [Dendrobium nobile]